MLSSPNWRNDEPTTACSPDWFQILCANYCGHT